MNTPISLTRLLRRWLPLTTVIVAVVVAAWQITISLLLTFDQQLSEDRIIAQEERLDTARFSQFEDRQKSIIIPAPDRQVQRDPFGT